MSGDMKRKDEVLMGLKALQSATPSKWRENAEWRHSNKGWLMHSRKIAMMMLDRMEELNLTQKSVVEKLGCSQQYVSKLLKGTENLSIETITKIESALNIPILRM